MLLIAKCSNLQFFQQITSWVLSSYKQVAYIKTVYKPNHFYQKRNGLKKSLKLQTYIRFKQIREGITQKIKITIITVLKHSLDEIDERFVRIYFCSFFIALLSAKSLHQTLHKPSCVQSRIVDGQKAFSNSRMFDFSTFNI